MKKAPKPKKVGTVVKDQQEYLKYKQNKDPQFSRGQRFFRKAAPKTKTGLLSGQ